MPRTIQTGKGYLASGAIPVRFKQCVVHGLLRHSFKPVRSAPLPNLRAAKRHRKIHIPSFPFHLRVWPACDAVVIVEEASLVAGARGVNVDVHLPRCQWA
jgi:hypothetical protein